MFGKLANADMQIQMVDVLNQFESPKDPSKEILVYVSSNVIGKWEIINAVISPKAAHKSTISVKIGKSKTNSMTSTFEYKWESSFGVEIKAITASVSQSVRFMIEKTSSETWTEEKKQEQRKLPVRL
ncbi:hypothetical protein MAR_002896 [Mya arenaria]|uniref:Uncharacterized protein n=1 Tax=Mya arenaria TaxID=6604 RepID=A0ABY7G4F6_MYAAR|nr:hypothetical protein MAR_002896 [Mya arenaria]